MAVSDQRAARAPGTARTVTAAVLVVLGVAAWVLAAVRARHEPRSYSASSPPPAYVAVTAGRQYSLDTPGGLAAVNRVIDPQALHCTVTPRGGTASSLTVTPETNTKAVHEIGTFYAPVTGQAHVACAQIGDVYVDDADGATDVAGLLRLLATVLLTVGVPLAIGALSARWARRADHAGSVVA